MMQLAQFRSRVHTVWGGSAACQHGFIGAHVYALIFRFLQPLQLMCLRRFLFFFPTSAPPVASSPSSAPSVSTSEPGSRGAGEGRWCFLTDTLESGFVYSSWRRRLVYRAEGNGLR